jgi:hypothetical protein
MDIDILEENAAFLFRVGWSPIWLSFTAISHISSSSIPHPFLFPWFLTFLVNCSYGPTLGCIPSPPPNVWFATLFATQIYNSARLSCNYFSVNLNLILHPEDGASMFLRNFGINHQDSRYHNWWKFLC